MAAILYYFMLNLSPSCPPCWPLLVSLHLSPCPFRALLSFAGKSCAIFGASTSLQTIHLDNAHLAVSVQSSRRTSRNIVVSPAFSPFSLKSRTDGCRQSKCPFCATRTCDTYISVCVCGQWSKSLITRSSRRPGDRQPTQENISSPPPPPPDDPTHHHSCESRCCESSKSAAAAVSVHMCMGTAFREKFKLLPTVSYANVFHYFVYHCVACHPLS